MRNIKLFAAALAAALPIVAAACGSDPPISTQPEEGDCFEGVEGKPCKADGGYAGSGGDGGNSNKPPVDGGAGSGGDSNTGGTGGKDSGSGGSGGSDSGSGGGDTGGSGGGDTGGSGGGDGGSGCDGLEVKCSGVCKDLDWDYLNCGACGNKCTGGTTCQDGACLPCPSGTWNCTTQCADFKTDENNCGGCNVKCDPGETCHAQSGPPWGLCY